MALLDEFLAVDIVTTVREGSVSTEQPQVQSISYCTVSGGNVGVPQTITAGADGVQGLLTSFESFVFQTYTQPGKKWCLVTNGMWQLQTGLRQAAAAAGASLSNSWLRYFNIRSEAAKCLQRPQSFPDLDSTCNALGLTSYNSTPGENAASTLGYAVKVLLQKQHQFAKPTVWDPDVAAQAPAASVPQTVGGTTCLRLRGIPFQSNESELREFFSGFAVDKVVIRYDPVSGRPRGDAIVSFTSVEEAERAMQARNQQVLGSRYVEIFSAQPDELAQAAAMAVEFEHNTANILRLRGIPFQANEGEVEALFRTNEIPIVPGSVVIALGGDGRPSGSAFVKTVSDDATTRALGLPRANTYMGTRYVEIYRATETEYQTAQRPRHVMPAAQPPAYYPSAPGEHIVRLRGLPFSATEMDIVSFFTGINIAPQGVHLVYNAESRPSGEAFVELVSAHDVQAALQLDRSQMGHRYIEVYQSSSAEMNRGGRGAAYPSQRYQPYGGFPGAHPGAHPGMRPMGRTAGGDPYGAFAGAYRQPPR